MLINRMMNKFRLMNMLDEGGDGGEPEFDSSEFIDVEENLEEANDEEAPIVEEEAPAEEPEQPAGEPEPVEPVVETPPVEEESDPAPLTDEPEETPEVPEQPTEAAQTAEKEKWLGELAERYKLSEEDADTMVSSPEKILPQLAANMHAQILGDVLQAVSGMIPQALAQAVQAQPHVIAEAMTSHTSAEQKRSDFFKAYPQLVGKESVIKEVAKTVQANFADLSFEQQLDKTGQVAMAMLGLQVEAPQAEAPSEPAPEPFVPAKSGGGSPPATGASSEWEEFI